MRVSRRLYESESVTVYYDMIATDTDYFFYTDSDDVDLTQKFDGSHGYVFTFTMPAHDVKISVKSRNSMETDPYANMPQDTDLGSPKDSITDANLMFDYYEATVATVGGDESEDVLGTAWGQYYSELDTETWFCPECGARNNRRYCMDCGMEKPE